MLAPIMEHPFREPMLCVSAPYLPARRIYPLEEKLARFKHTEASLTFQSGYATNLGVISALMLPEDIIISDELNHASIIDGIRLNRTPRKVYPHRDMAGLRRVLEESRGAGKVMVVTDGVFSMDG